MDGEAESSETPEAFLTALGKDLKDKAGVDKELADILNTFILKITPDQNAVGQAKDAILKLAAERATPQKAEVAHG